LLQGRLFSYTDTQLSRLGGPNFHELPINRGVCPFHNFQRDGMHRMTLNTGRISYEPNSLATGAEFRVDGGQQGFQSFAEATEPPKIRRRSASFDDHFSQASFFWNSQSPVERDHIIAAFQFELSKVETPAVRQRVVDNLAHVDSRLARKVAEPLGIAMPDARAAAGRAGFRDKRGKLPMESSAALSMEASVPPSNGNAVATRRVAILAAGGVEIGAMRVIQQALQEAGAATCVLSDRLGSVATSSGQQLQVDHTMQAMPSVMFDAVLVPGGAAHVQALMRNGDAVHFVLEAYKHCKALCVIGEGVQLLQGLGVEDAQGAAALPGVVVGRNDPPLRAQLAHDFIAAIAKHRHWLRANLDAIPA
jgi:catalase